MLLAAASLYFGTAATQNLWPFANSPGAPTPDASELTERGTAAYNKGRYPESLNYFQQALVIAREVGDCTGETWGQADEYRGYVPVGNPVILIVGASTGSPLDGHRVLTADKLEI